MQTQISQKLMPVQIEDPIPPLLSSLETFIRKLISNQKMKTLKFSKLFMTRKSPINMPTIPCQSHHINNFFPFLLNISSSTSLNQQTPLDVQPVEPSQDTIPIFLIRNNLGHQFNINNRKNNHFPHLQEP